MKHFVVLYEGEIVALSDISDDQELYDSNNLDLMFFSSGRVRRFKKGGKFWMAVFKDLGNNNWEFNGYRSEKIFWDTNNVKLSNNSFGASSDNLGERFPVLDIVVTKGKEGDKIILVHKSIKKIGSEYKIVTKYREIPFNVEKPNVNLELTSSYTPQSIYSSLIPYINFILNKKVLNVNNELVSIDLDDDFPDYLDVLDVLDYIYTTSGILDRFNSLNLKEPFDSHINLASRYSNNFTQIEPAYHNLYTKEYFARFRLGLIELKYWLLQYSDDYSKIDELKLTVLGINLFPLEELSYLKYATKVKIIDNFLLHSFWIIGDWYINSINEEQALLKIINAFARKDSNGVYVYSEINAFFDLLNKTYDTKGDKTLFITLYDRINDGAIFDDDGDGNRGQLIKGIYNLWLKSKYNPFHSVQTIADNALNNFEYTPYNSRWKVFDTDIDLLDKIPDYNAAPLIINYESDKKLLWYIDNYKFEFYGKKILAKEDIKDYGYQPYGVYDVFQPVSIKETDANETIMNLPLLNLLKKDNPVEGELYNCIPVFYLMYVDEVGDKSDAKNTISTIFDVVLTFTGIGNLPKLRYLKSLSLFGRLLRPGSVALTTLETAKLIRAFKGLFNTFEAVSGVASLAHSLLASSTCDIYFNSSGQPPSETDPEYQSYQECKEFQNNIDFWLGAVEIFSMSADIITSRMLKNATKKLRNSIPLDASFDTFRTAVHSIDNLGNDLIGFLNRLQDDFPSIRTKIDAFLEEEKIAFMFEYGDNMSALPIIENNAPALMDNWKLLFNKKINDRTNLDFIAHPTRTTNIITYYDASTPLRKTLEELSDSKRWDFLDRFGTASSTNFAKFVAKPDLVKYWKRYHYDNAIEGFQSLNHSKQLNFLEDYGDCTTDVFNRIKKGNLIKYWGKVDDNPLDVSVHSTYIKRVDYLESVRVANNSSHNGETLVQHLRASLKKAVHNGTDLVYGYTGFHFDFKITELFEITPTTSVINGKTYMTGPLPTVSATVQTAIKAGTTKPGTGVKECEILLWGYARENVGKRKNPIWQFVLDSNGDPVKAWVPKINNGGKTTIFVGMSEEKTLNEIAFVRLNLDAKDFIPTSNVNGASNEWTGISSEGFRINMYVNPTYNYGTLPTASPNLNTVYNSAFPKR